MGFEELGDGLIDWLGDWIDKVSGGAELAVPQSEPFGKIIVSIYGELLKLDLQPGASKVPAAQLATAIERAYADAYKESFRQLGLVFDRLEHDVADNTPLLAKVRAMRAELADPGAVRRLLKHRQSYRDEQIWDPAADPLRRNL